MEGRANEANAFEPNRIRITMGDGIQDKAEDLVTLTPAVWTSPSPTSMTPAPVHMMMPASPPANGGPS